MNAALPAQDSQWAARPERGTVLGIWFVLQVSRLLGYAPGYWLLRPIAFFQLFGNHAGRRASVAYLQQLGELPASAGFCRRFWAAYRHHRDFAINAYDRIWFAQDRLDLFDVQLERHDLIESIVASGRGAVVVSCHIGSFEIMRSLSRHYQVEVVPVMYGASSRKFMAALQAVRPDYKLDVIYMEEQGPLAALQIQQAVDAGKLVAIMADRIPPAGVQSRLIDAPFLGKMAPFNLNPWIVAAALRCPVLFAAGVRTGYRRYRVFGETLADPLRSDRKAPFHGLGEVVATYALRLENLCRKYPRQWFNFYDFWGKAS